MALSYVPPGVLPAQEIQASPLAPNVASQTVPIIIGEAAGYQTYSENIQLSGTTPVNLAKRGLNVSEYGTTLYNLAVTVTNPNNDFNSVGPANYFIQYVSAGTTTGDETYSIRRTSTPGTLSLSIGTAGTVIPSGTYRYAASYVVDIQSGTSVTNYETGLGVIGTATVLTPTGSVTVSNLGTATPADISASGGSVVGKNVYRSINEGTNTNPNWGPWKKVTSGTAVTADTSTNSYVDTTADISTYATAPQGIANGDTVTVQYQYTDTAYWEPTIFSDFNDITDKYGNAFTDVGNINSQVSFAAKLAMLNGASNVVVAPLPVNGEARDSDWEDALRRLEEDYDGNLIVPISGRTAVHSLVAAHITKMKQKNVWKGAILGMDGSGTTTVSAETLRATAQSYNNSDVVLVSPAIFNYNNSYLNVEVPVGGQYAAACMSGMHASRTLAESLTRKQVAGLSSVGEKRTTVGKNQDAQSGLTVIEQIPSTGTIRIRHEISTAPGDINTREFPVTLQRNNMVNIIAQTIDNSIIGQIFADSSAPGKVSLLVGQLLDTLVRSGNLGAYAGVTSRISPSDPTVVDVRWQYRPVYTVQYVQISFGINLNTGAVTTGGINLVL